MHAADSLADLAAGEWVVVDAQTPQDLDDLGKSLRQELFGAGKRHFCQSAASLLNGLAQIPAIQFSLAQLPPRQGPGLVLVGSYVPLADQQLELLLAEPSCRGVEFPVDQWLANPASKPLDLGLQRQQLSAIAAAGLTPVLFSSRGERQAISASQQNQLALAMAELALSLPPPLAYLIAKGGTTSFTLLRDGLGLERLRLLGQLLPGLSLLQAQPAHPIWGEMPIVTFPGNLGDASSLKKCWQLLEQWRLGA